MHRDVPRLWGRQVHDLEIVGDADPERVMVSGETSGEEPIVIALTMSNAGPVRSESDARHKEDLDRRWPDGCRLRLSDAELTDRQIVAFRPQAELHRPVRSADGQNDLNPAIDKESNRWQQVELASLG